MKADYKQLIQRLRAMRLLIEVNRNAYLCDALDRASDWRCDYVHKAIWHIIMYGIGEHWCFEQWHKVTHGYWPTSEEARKALAGSHHRAGRGGRT